MKKNILIFEPPSLLVKGDTTRNFMGTAKAVVHDGKVSLDDSIEEPSVYKSSVCYEYLKILDHHFNQVRVWNQANQTKLDFPAYAKFYPVFFILKRKNWIQK